MKLDKLKENPRNPRKVTTEKLNVLKKSLDRFGDLSGMVFNRRTRRIISGHMRKRVLSGDHKITIDKKYEIPTKRNTIAEGYIEIDGERYKYREVDVDEKWETAAMLAANKIHADWDNDLLRVVLSDLPKAEIDFSGFEELDLRSLNINPKLESITLDKDPRSNPLRPEELPIHPAETKQEAAPVSFSSVKETAAAIGKRFIIIIDCPSQEAKDALREKVQPLLTEAGAKVF